MLLIIFKIYILGFFLAVLDFSNDVKNAQGNPMNLTLLTAFIYVIQTTKHLKYTAKSWIYFINK